MTIKFNFAKFNLATAFQIKEQDPEFMNKKFIATNGLCIKSSDSPSIDYKAKTIFVRGSVKQNDINTVITYFDTNSKRDFFYSEVLEAFQELSSNRDKWEALNQ